MSSELAIKAIAANLATCLYATQTKMPEGLKKSLCFVGWQDPIYAKTESFFKMILIEYAKLLSASKNLLLKKVELVNSEKIRCKVFQYEFDINDKPFHCITLGNNKFSGHPLSALADSILAYEVKDGCDNCGFSEDGCERCGFNKARKLVSQDSVLKPFSKNADALWEALGEGRKEALLDMARYLNANISKVVGDDEEEEADDFDDPDEDEMEEPFEPKRFLIDESEIREKLFGDEGIVDDDE